jgi:hypothetical protein
MGEERRYVVPTSTGVPPEQLLIERSIDFLKSRGRAAMIIANHMLANPIYECVR